MNLSELQKILNGEIFGQDVTIQNLTTDSKTANAGDLYVARKGANLDGHDFIAEAVSHGAIAAMVERKIAIDLPQIIVPNSTKALGILAAWKRRNFHNPVLAITGSCGKTTTKEVLANILRQTADVFVNIKSFNNAVGLPLTMWHLKPEQKFAVIEVGANHHGEISALMQLVKPVKVAAITNAEACHLEGFGDVPGVARAKAEIFEGLATDGIAILNRDSDYFSYWQSIIKGKQSLSFGLTPQADIYAENLTFKHEYCEFTLHTPTGSCPILLALPGKHNIMNALTAVAAAYAVGVDLENIKNGLEQARPVMMRQVVHVGFNDAKIIDDTYNANPKAVAAALEVLMRENGRKIFVFGGMRELGDESAKWHNYIGKLARDLGVEALFVCGQFADDTAKGFGSAANVFVSQDELVAALKPILDNNSVVLVKGSRGAEMEKVVAQLKMKE